MNKLFGNLHLVLVIGLVLAIGVMFAGFSTGVPDLQNGIFQWIHVFFGITWIGLLYYFNFVQTPVMPTIPADLKPGVTKYIAPKALFFFRWAAVLTMLSGLYLLHLYGEDKAIIFQEPGKELIGVGMWLGLIMAFNVWVFIWPAQKKVLGIVTVADDVKAKAAKTGLIFSRINVMLSIPMLYCMTNMH